MPEAERWTDERFAQVAEEAAGGRHGRAVALVLAGMAIGAGLALLLAPKSGSEIREKIGRGYRRTIEELTGRAQDLRDRAQDLTDDLRERVPNLLRFSRRPRRVGREIAP